MLKCRLLPTALRCWSEHDDLLIFAKGLATSVALVVLRPIISPHIAAGYPLTSWHRAHLTYNTWWPIRRGMGQTRNA
jgi:hypothetical protein